MLHSGLPCPRASRWIQPMGDKRIEEGKAQVFMSPLPSLSGHRRTTESHSTCQVAVSYNGYNSTPQVQETMPSPHHSRCWLPLLLAPKYFTIPCWFFLTLPTPPLINPFMKLSLVFPGAIPPTRTQAVKEIPYL